MRDDLVQALEAVRDDPDTRAVVLSGAGDRGFCAGADLTEFGSAPSPIVARQVRWERDIWGLFLSLRKPTVAALHGHVIGSGVEMALLCDIRIASEDAVFRMPETGLSLVPAAGGTQTLARHAGVGPALAMLLERPGDRQRRATIRPCASPCRRTACRPRPTSRELAALDHRGGRLLSAPTCRSSRAPAGGTGGGTGVAWSQISRRHQS